MREVTIFVMRHGEKNGDALTDEGVGQVRSSTVLHLMPHAPFDLVVRTAWNRARETAQTIITNLGCNFPSGFDGEIDDGFDFRDLDRWLQPPIDWDIQKRQWAQLGRGVPTVQQLFDQIPQALAFAGQARYAVRRLATRLVVQKAEFGKAIVVSHSPVAEAAAPDPENFVQLAPADIVVYTVRVTDGVAQIVNAEHLGCPVV